MSKIVLASGSPRRKEILERLGLNHVVKKSDFDESTVAFTNPSEYVLTLSGEKCKQIALLESGDTIVMGADTIVYYDSKALEKPVDEKEARQFLQMLSNNWHQVYTGVTMIHCGSGEKFINVLKSEVKFRELTEDEIAFYINSNEWHDKAGGYGIQGLGALLVEGIEGDFFNIMGLAPQVVYQGLKALGFNLMK